MKKSQVAIGVIVALGVIWTGAAWYTGKMAESQMDGAIAQVNDQLHKLAPQAGLTVSSQNYQRGIFSSHVQLVLKPQEGAKESFLSAGQEIVLDETISHGPFPGAQLARFNLIPSMASVSSALVNNATTKPVFDLTKGQSPVTINTRISYGGATTSTVDLVPVDYDKAPYKVAFAGGSLDISVDSAGDTISTNGALGRIQVESVNEYNQKVGLVLNSLKTSGETHLSKFAERIGEQRVAVDNAVLSVEGKEMASLNGFSLDAKSDAEADGKHLGGQVNYTVDALKIQNQSLGSGKLAIAVSHLDGEGLHKFREQYNSQVEALLAQPDVVADPTVYQQKVLDIFVAGLPDLLKGQPVITIAPLSWKNEKGESTFTLNMAMNDPTGTPDPQTLDQAVDRYVKNIDSKLVIPVDMATALMTQVAKLEGYQEEEAGKLAEQQVKGLAAMGQMFRITTMQDNSILATLSYNAGQVTLNGQKMPLSDFAGMFGLSGLPDNQDSTPDASPEAPQTPDEQQDDSSDGDQQQDSETPAAPAAQ